LDLGVVAEVDEQTELHACGLEIVDDLGTMLVGEIWDGLQLQNDLPEANDVWNEGVFETAAFVEERELALSVERDSLNFKFGLQTFLIDGLSKTASFELIDLKASSSNAEGFFGVDQFAHGELGWPTEHTEYAKGIRRQKWGRVLKSKSVFPSIPCVP
jgi:hypothetical protein